MIVDLTQRIAREIPVWPGDPAVEIAVHATIDRDGYLLERIGIGAHTGTHVGVAAHMRRGGTTVDALPATSLVLAAFVIDVRDRCDERYRLTIDDVIAFEAVNGRIAERSAVLLCTGWSGRWPDPLAYLGSVDGSRLAWPGYSLEAARFLATQRSVMALGIDTHGIDAGDDAALSVNRWWLDGERYHIENLTRLDQVPPTGASLVVGALPLAGCSGAPARVIAVWGARGDSKITHRA